MSLTNQACSIAPITEEADTLLKRQILWVLFFRVILLTVLLGLTVFLHSRGDYESPLPSLGMIASFITLIYIFTIGSALLIKIIPCSKPFAYLQLSLDVLLTTTLVVFSGGSQSILLIIYFFPIVSAASLLFKRGALFIAALAALSYGSVLWVEFHGLFPSYLPANNLTHVNIALHRFAVSGLSFFLIAFLSSILAKRLQIAERELSVTIMDRDRLAMLYKQIFEDITTGIITVDSSRRITSFNTAANTITGFTSEQALGTPFATLLPTLWAQDTGSLRSMAEITRADGFKIPVGYTWTKLNMPGESGDYRVYTMQDLSRIREMEGQIRQAEKMAAIGRMAAGIAHEFRNPLAAMSGAAQLLEGELGSNHTTKSLMNIIIRESDRLEATIYEFLQFSRPAQLEKHWFPLAVMVQESITMAKNDPGWNESLQIDTEITEGLDYRGDANQLRQVCINLLTNAFHAVAQQDKGHIRIAAREEHKQDGEYIILQVCDNGHGIPEKAYSKIFDPFFTRREKGTGLGLAIVQQIIDSHHGIITVGTCELGGASFTILLPLVMKQ